MKRSEIIMIIISFVIAALVAFGVYYLLVVRQQENMRQKTPIEQCTNQATYKEIAIAKKQIYLGQPINSEVLEYVKWPEEALKADFYLRSNVTDDTFKQYVAQRTITAGEPITKSNIVDTKNQGALAALLKPGMRAVSINVDPASISSGLIVPGDTVDTIVTFSSTDSKGTEMLSKTVLCSVRVLALDQKTNDRPPEVDPKAPPPAPNAVPYIPRTATIEVTPSQAETLLLAAKTGVVFLSLHPATGDIDQSCIPTSLVKPKEVPPKPKAVDQGVKIIRGSASEDKGVKP